MPTNVSNIRTTFNWTWAVDALRHNTDFTAYQITEGCKTFKPTTNPVYAQIQLDNIFTRIYLRRLEDESK